MVYQQILALSKFNTLKKHVEKSDSSKSRILDLDPQFNHQIFLNKMKLNWIWIPYFFLWSNNEMKLTSRFSSMLSQFYWLLNRLHEIFYYHNDRTFYWIQLVFENFITISLKVWIERFLNKAFNYSNLKQINSI